MELWLKYFVFGLFMTLRETALAHDNCDNVVDIVCNTHRFSTLCDGIKRAGLESVLYHGFWTIFAPTNKAFAELGSTLFNAMWADHDVLTDVLLFHAVNDVVDTDDLYCTGITKMANGQGSRTVCGWREWFQKGGSNVRGDMPRVIDTNIRTCQGYIHVVDEVMLPTDLDIDLPHPSYCQSIAEIACDDDDTFSTLCEAVKEADLVNTLSGGHWTVFAPTNDAFDALGDSLNVVLSRKPLLKDILLFHVVEDQTLFSEDLECTELTPMANGENTRTVCRDDDTFQQGNSNSRGHRMPKIIKEDIVACNGVIHVIDQVLLP